MKNAIYYSTKLVLPTIVSMVRYDLIIIYVSKYNTI